MPPAMPAAAADGSGPAGSLDATGEGTGSPAAAGPAAASRDAAGWLLRRLSVLPVLLAMAGLLAGLPLLLAGRFTPALVLAISALLAAALIYLGLRPIPGRWPGSLPAQGRPPRTPWWAAIGVLAVATGFGADQMIFHSQQIIILRDPASYVVIIDSRVSNRLTEVVRGMCDDPAAVIGRRHLGRVEQVVRGIERAGRRPVLLARKRSELTPYGGLMREIMVLNARQDDSTWEAAPRGTGQLKERVWMLEPTP
jgi:hypothetical protein